MLYVNYEKSYDKFFPNHERVYRVYMDYFQGEKFEAGDAQTYNLSGPSLCENFPEITNFVRTYALGNTSIVYQQNAIQSEFGHIVDSSYFDVFGHPIIKGNKATALNAPNSIVLSEKLAATLFKNEDALGKTIEMYSYGSKTIATVSAVMKNVPSNTHMQTDFLVSFDTGQDWNVGRWDLNWDNNNFYTYISINKGIHVNSLREKIMQFEFNNEDERHNIEALTAIHLYSDKPYELAKNGSSTRVQFLLAIAIVIIVLSWLNYVNLTISKSLERAVETGVRKVSGASKSQLLSQFLTESSLLNAISIIISIVIASVALPLFNSFAGKDLSIGILNARFYLILFVIIAVGSISSGIIPAIFLSKVNPSLILKGKNSKNIINNYAQKVFVSTQIVATIVLIVSTIGINKQIQFLQNQPKGFNNNHVISITGDIFDDSQDSEKKHLILKSELDKLSGVKATAISQTYPGQGFINMSTAIGITSPDGIIDNYSTIYNYSINEDYIPLLNYELLAGRNYEVHDKGKNVLIINEEMSKTMGYNDAKELIGKYFKTWGNSYKVIGVVKNHAHFGLKTPEQPMLYQYADYHSGNLLVKLTNSDFLNTKATLSEIEEVWYSIFKQSLFKYTFIDEQFNQQFNEDIKFNKAFGIFTMLAILIASLGLFGLGTQICVQRTKEIGVRKVNGAKIIEVIAMLNKEFVQWVVIAFVIAAPVSYLTLQQWLENFTNKTSLNWWIFAIGGLSALTIALLTVSWQTFKAARRNPVEALRYE